MESERRRGKHGLATGLPQWLEAVIVVPRSSELQARGLQFGQPTICEVVAPKYVAVDEVPVPCQSTCVNDPWIQPLLPWKS